MRTLTWPDTSWSLFDDLYGLRDEMNRLRDEMNRMFDRSGFTLNGSSLSMCMGK